MERKRRQIQMHCKNAYCKSLCNWSNIFKVLVTTIMAFFWCILFPFPIENANFHFSSPMQKPPLADTVESRAVNSGLPHSFFSVALWQRTILGYGTPFRPPKLAHIENLTGLSHALEQASRRQKSREKIPVKPLLSFQAWHWVSMQVSTVPSSTSLLATTK